MDFDNSGSVQNQLTIPQVTIIRLMMPPPNILDKYDLILKLIYKKNEILSIENQKLEELKELLLAKMTKVESEVETVEN